MPLKNFVYLWLGCVAFLTYEHLAINYAQHMSVLNYLKSHFTLFSELRLTTETGRPISYYLGWAGFLTMLVTNIYILRKKLYVMSKWGKLKNWLNFHIFCGLMGPTLIIFHTDFKVGGLVALSFWSMMIVATSGVVGRYFYIQVVSEKVQLEKEVTKWNHILERMAEKAQVESEKMAIVKKRALQFVGGDVSGRTDVFSLIKVFAGSFVGDLKLLVSAPQTLPVLHRDSDIALCNYALAQRKVNYLKPFQKLLGYWHSFHIPFTIVMYITAVIHIIVALLFQAS